MRVCTSETRGLPPEQLRVRVDLGLWHMPPRLCGYLVGQTKKKVPLSLLELMLA